MDGACTYILSIALGVFHSNVIVMIHKISLLASQSLVSSDEALPRVTGVKLNKART